MGSGFKTFTAGSVLTASDVNNYLMTQSVMVFASTAARDAAITAPVAGMTAYINSNDVNEGNYVYNGSSWVRVDVTQSVITYTPALTASSSNPTLGSGSTAEGVYIKSGVWVTGAARIIFGSSGVSAGSGDYWISLPLNTAMNAGCLGSGYLFDSSAVAWRTVVLESAGTNIAYLNMGSSSRAQSANPWTWAASDQIQINFSYQVAA